MAEHGFVPAAWCEKDIGHARQRIGGCTDKFLSAQRPSPGVQPPQSVTEERQDVRGETLGVGEMGDVGLSVEDADPRVRE